jgi:hypothetical protein
MDSSGCASHRSLLSDSGVIGSRRETSGYGGRAERLRPHLDHCIPLCSAEKRDDVNPRE